MQRSLPVLMYHYVCRYSGPIAVSPECFEEHCAGMAAAGWRGVALDEAEAWLRDGTPLPGRSVLITFDDGFLDNYVNAWPILKKYGHKAVVFAVTDRIGQGGAPRATLGDVWDGTAAAPDLPDVDNLMHPHELGYEKRRDLFMDWSEARRMEESGIVAVAAHTARHELVFSAPDIPARSGAASNACADAASRFLVPGERGNTFYRIAGDVPWGLPLFPTQPAMSGPAFLPSADLLSAVRGLVPQQTHEAFAFFQSAERVAELHALIDGFSCDALGRMEHEDEARCRMRGELARCANTLQKELGHGCASLCWPWGRAGDWAKAEALDLGFSVLYETRAGANPPGNPLAVKRFKVREKPWPWLKLRLNLYSRPWLANAYGRVKGK